MTIAFIIIFIPGYLANMLEHKIKINRHSPGYLRCLPDNLYIFQADKHFVSEQLVEHLGELRLDYLNNPARSDKA